MKMTGESNDGLRKVNDLIRAMAFMILLLNIYYYNYGYFAHHKLQHEVAVKILGKLTLVGVFDSPHWTLGFVFMCLLVTALGMGVRKRKKLNLFTDISFFLLSTLLLFGSRWVLNMRLDFDLQPIAYGSSCLLGTLGVMRYSTRLPRHLRTTFDDSDTFNEKGEQFPQQTQLIKNKASVNLPMLFKYKNKMVPGFVNIINVYRAVLVIGSQGSGKTYSVLDPAIRQLIAKGFTMCVYAYKFHNSALLVYNEFLRNRKAYPKNTRFAAITFDDPSVSVRCNPLGSGAIANIPDAAEAAQAILLNLNHNWVTKRGDFFVESAINYLTACIYYLHIYDQKYNQENGEVYCSLPHCIELMSLDVKDVVPVLSSEAELTNLMAPFASAMNNGAAEQLEGQVASVRIPMTRLEDPNFYYLATGNDITLDINNPDNPTLLVLGSNHKRKAMYSAYLGVYYSTIFRLINEPGRLPLGFFVDELDSIYLSQLSSTITTGRENKISVWMGLQGKEQLEETYGQKGGEKLYSIVGNIISGQVNFATAEMVSKLFGKTLQKRVSQNQNSDDVSFNTSLSPDQVLPPNKLSQLSQGEVAGVVSDNADQTNNLKLFKGKIVLPDKKIARQKKQYQPLPKINDISKEEIEQNYYKVKWQIGKLVLETLEQTD